MITGRAETVGYLTKARLFFQNPIFVAERKHPKSSRVKLGQAEQSIFGNTKDKLQQWSMPIAKAIRTHLCTRHVTVV